MSATSPVPLVRRQVALDFSDVPAPPWAPGQGLLELLYNTCSLMFPVGERYFATSVRDCLDRVKDPVLLEQARGFIHQEAMHARLHADWNAMLAKHYSTCHLVDRLARLYLATTLLTSRPWRLAVSTAIEHFTAIAGETVLRDIEGRQTHMPPAVAAMWLWHAAEETEHKAVCFDVHRAVVGSGTYGWLHRVVVMALAAPLFLSALAIGAFLLQCGRRRRLAPARLAPEAPRGPRNLFGLLRQIVPGHAFFAYFGRSFHPWNNDNSHLLAEWQRHYPGFGEAGLTKAMRQ